MAVGLAPLAARCVVFDKESGLGDNLVLVELGMQKTYRRTEEYWVQGVLGFDTQSYHHEGRQIQQLEYKEKYWDSGETFAEGSDIHIAVANLETKTLESRAKSQAVEMSVA